MYSDPSGHFIISISAAITAAINAAYYIFVASVIAVGVAVTASTVIDVVESIDFNNNPKDQSVYIMRNKYSNEVQYVGRTNNPIRRQKEHDRDVTKSDLLPLEVKFTGLTVQEARAMEQLLISSYMLDNLLNARREIAVGKVGNYAGRIYTVLRLFGSSIEDEFLNLMGR